MNRRNAVPMHVTPSHPANRDALGRARTLTPEQFARATEDGEIEGIEHLGFRLADVVAARSRAGSIK